MAGPTTFPQKDQLQLELVPASIRPVWRQHSSPTTCSDYEKGLRKFAEFLRQQRRQPLKPKTIQWQQYIGSLSAGLQENVRDFCPSACVSGKKSSASSGLCHVKTRADQWVGVLNLAWICFSFGTGGVLPFEQGPGHSPPNVKDCRIRTYVL